MECDMGTTGLCVTSPVTGVQVFKSGSHTPPGLPLAAAGPSGVWSAKDAEGEGKPKWRMVDIEYSGSTQGCSLKRRRNDTKRDRRRRSPCAFNRGGRWLLSQIQWRETFWRSFPWVWPSGVWGVQQKEPELSALQINLWQLQKQRNKQELTILLYVHVYTPRPPHLNIRACLVTVPGWKFLCTASDTRLECTAELLGTTHSATVWFYKAEHAEKGSLPHLRRGVSGPSLVLAVIALAKLMPTWLLIRYSVSHLKLLKLQNKTSSSEEKS